MPVATIPMRVTLQGDVADIKALIHHDMETGLRKDTKTGQLIPAHFINVVTATLNGVTVLQAQWGIGISKNPFIEFKVNGAKSGDKIVINAVDNLGAQHAGEAVLA